MSDLDEHTFLTMADIASILHVDIETARGFVTRKKDPLPAIRPSRQYLVDRKDFKEWLSRQRPQQPSDE